MPLGYRLVRALSRLLLRLFYRRVEVVGAERIPPRGPLLVLANHQNALVDGMLLLAVMPRRLRPLAKAPLFSNPLIGPLLRMTGAIPVVRRQDTGTATVENTRMFEAAGRTLAEGGAILIFPEGKSQPEPVLQPLRSGAARLLLGAEAAQGRALDSTVVPVGLLFNEPGTFRSGWAHVLVGEPLRLGETRARYALEPEAAVRDLTERMEDALGALLVEAGDRETQRLLHVAESLWRAEADAPAADAEASAEWRRRAVRAYRWLRPREPERIFALRREIYHYAELRERSGLGERGLGAPLSRGNALRWALRETLLLILGLPLALWGLATHAAPYRLNGWLVRLARPDGDVEATYKLLLGMVLFPLGWIAEGWLTWRVGGWPLLGFFLVALVPSGLFALGWKDRLERVARATRGLVHLLTRRDLRRFLVARRRGLATEFEALVRLVPEAVLDGSEEDRKHHI
jgi:1-acyl-sn-glycerol-3-phosphate acyltransferase